MINQTKNEKLGQAYRYGWESAIKCLQDVYKNGVDPLAEILVLDHFKKNRKKRKPIKEAENDWAKIYRLGLCDFLRNC